ncbi:MAG: DNA-3-methyladenine glycosylase 2 family protein [Deltaproteobacteria bacterium]|nr:MAG: DNA-3-methyladenine glycosylase 2 family protein [Deltaproteobacteria bacterium]
MHLDPEICYRALRTRDARFDGRFFTAVRSTGIYCRPICPARTPRRENCWFVPCAAAAEAAGYRPCRRCRPECAPGTPAWLGTSATVSRGLRLIADGALDAGGVPDLAARLGLGERQLRRLFALHLGAGPLAIARTRRAHFAAELLARTDWPVSRVALASGYTSLRRFNEAIRATFHRAPRELRAARRRPPAHATVRLPYRAPFDGAGVFAYLAARAVPGIERVGDRSLRRALRIAGRPVVVEVDATASAGALELSATGADATHWLALAERARSVFDLGSDPGEIARELGSDPLLRARLNRRPGVRLPGAWDPFEIAVRIVLGQQVTVAGATRLAGRLAARFGERLPDAQLDAQQDPQLLFPEPEVLADAPLEEIGLTRQRASALRALAAVVARGSLALAPGADPDAAREALLALPGIGPWTAELVLLRALGEPDAFPAGDLGLRRALGCDARALERRAERWRPWRAYAAMLLWTTPPARSTSAVPRAAPRRVATTSRPRAARDRR